jgi:hypothetical protein
MARQQIRLLRRGWTAGAGATAAAPAALTALLSGRFPDPVSIRLPRGATASVPFAELGEGRSRAGIVKDARRYPWRACGRQPLDHWIKVDSMVDALESIGRFHRRAFLTIDAGENRVLRISTGVRFLVRLVEPLRRAVAVASLRGRRRTRPWQRNVNCLSSTRSTCWSARRAAVLPQRRRLPRLTISAFRLLWCGVRLPEPGDAVETVEAALHRLAGEHTFRKAKRVS